MNANLSWELHGRGEHGVASMSCQCVGIVPHISGKVGVRLGDMDRGIGYDWFTAVVQRGKWSVLP